MQLGLTVGDDIDRIDRYGREFDFVEVGIGEGQHVLESSPEALETARSEAGCELTVHLPFKQDLVTPVAEINDAIVEFLSRLLEVAGRAGATAAVLHLTARNPSDTTLRSLAVNQLEQVAGAGDGHGVEVVAENVGHQARGFPISVVTDLCEQASVPVCVDLGHAFMEDGMDGVERILDSARGRIRYVHVHDVRSRGDTHLPLGAGQIDFEAVANRGAELDGHVAIEVFADDEHLLTDSAKRTRRHFGIS